MRRILLAVAVGSLAISSAVAQGQQGRCSGCGCKGGPGYRGPDGTCVAHRQLYKVCGTPPTLRCNFEGAAFVAIGAVLPTLKPGDTTGEACAIPTASGVMRASCAPLKQPRPSNGAAVPVKQEPKPAPPPS